MRSTITQLDGEARRAAINWPTQLRGVRWLVSPADNGFRVDVWWTLPPSYTPQPDDVLRWQNWTHDRLRSAPNGDRISGTTMRVEPIITGA